MLGARSGSVGGDRGSGGSVGGPDASPSLCVTFIRAGFPRAGTEHVCGHNAPSALHPERLLVSPWRGSGGVPLGDGVAVSRGTVCSVCTVSVTQRSVLGLAGRPEQPAQIKTHNRRIRRTKTKAAFQIAYFSFLLVVPTAASLR